MRKILLLVFVITLACATSTPKYVNFIQPEIKNKKAKPVAEVTFKLLPSTHREYYYRFAPGDTVILNAWVEKGNDISKLEVEPYKGSVVFSFMRVPYVANRTFIADTGGIYVFRFFNSSSFKSKIYRFTIHRIAGEKDYAYFNTSVFWDTIYDTTYKWVKESTLVRYDYETERIVFKGFILNKGGHRCTKIDVPSGTSYVLYMVGVGDNFLQEISGNTGETALSLFKKGKTLRPLANKVNTNSSIDYAIDYSANRAVKFLNGESLHPVYGERNIIIDFGRVSVHSDCYLCVKNNSHKKDISVFQDVVAVKKVGVYSYRRVRKPFVRVYRVPK